MIIMTVTQLPISQLLLVSPGQFQLLTRYKMVPVKFPNLQFCVIIFSQKKADYSLQGECDRLTVTDGSQTKVTAVNICICFVLV